MSSYEIHGIQIEITEGDIAGQDGIDAVVVNAANAQLLTGGVAGALHRAAPAPDWRRSVAPTRR